MASQKLADGIAKLKELNNVPYSQGMSALTSMTGASGELCSFSYVILGQVCIAQAFSDREWIFFSQIIRDCGFNDFNPVKSSNKKC